MEGRSGRGIHTLLGHPYAGINPFPGFSGLTLLTVDWDGMVHPLYLLLYVPIGFYSFVSRLFVCM